MASSQVEIPSTSPFDCVLRDHNLRDACTKHAALQNNMKNFVRDHMNTCNISIYSDSATNQNTQKPIKNTDTWASRVVKNNIGNLSFTRRNHIIFKEKDDSSSLSALVSPRHSEIVDRWAAKQAREMVSSTLENEVDELENFPSTRSSSFNSRREDEISNLGASSLVQMWEKRLNQSNCIKPNAPTSLGRTSSTNKKDAIVLVEGSKSQQSKHYANPFERTSSTNENALCVEQQCMISEQREIIDEPQSSNEESFHDWESDETCSPKVHSSDGSESERGKVADIIKRLTTTNQMQSAVSLINDDNDNEVCSIVTGSPYRERDRASTPEQPEYRAFAQVTSSPCIRGCRAFHDLLMQFESDRHGELHNLAEHGAVSNFTQRGRIQSLLRLRLLQHGVAAQDQCSQKSTVSEVNGKPQGSGIMQLRERFNIGAEDRTSTPTEVSNSRSPAREMVSSITQLDNSPTPNQLSNKTILGTNKEEAHPSSDVTFQGTCFEDQNDDPKETVRTSFSMTDSSEQHYATTETSYEEEEGSHQHYSVSSYDEIVEEEEGSDHNYGEASYDWISPISRPRSYWEERRQEWYKEMLDFGSDKYEIRKLLERRTVSTFLSSDFRERMDKLMKSHMGTQTHLVNSQYNEEDDQESMEQLMAFFQERLHSRVNPQEDGRDGAKVEEERRNEEEVEKVEESITSRSDHESSSSMHTPSSSLLTTWSYRDNEARDDCDRVASISSQPLSQSQFFYHDTQQYSSSTNHHSIEMEFIYDLRRQMDQLSHEMSELRKSINSCMDMQLQSQQSNNKEFHTVKEEENKFHSRTPKKGNCCICYETKVNSLFYRCGHMCACLKCAKELQRNNGNCPICRAPIVDVVQVYVEC